jgi:hypothetical protein
MPGLDPAIPAAPQRNPVQLNTQRSRVDHRVKPGDDI